MVRLSKQHLEKLQEMARLDDRSATNYLERMIDQKYKTMEESKMKFNFEGKTYTVINSDRIEFNDDGNYETKVTANDGTIFNMIFNGNVLTDKDLQDNDVIEVY